MNHLLSFPGIIVALRHQSTLIQSIVAIGFGLAVLYLGLATRQFTATSQVFIETRGVKILNIQEILPDLGPDVAAIESQVEILRSRPIVERAIRKAWPEGSTVSKDASSLKNSEPAENSDYLANGQAGAAIAPSVGKAPVNDATNDADIEASPVFMKAIKNFRIQRLGLSNIIEVSYRDKDPSMAATMANALVDAYVEDQVDIKSSAARQATAYIQERISDLRNKVRASEARLPITRSSWWQRLDDEADRQLYEQLLKRLKETQAQESLQSADARIVSYADIPAHPSSPLVGATLGLAAIGSLGLGVLAALARELTNTTFRSAADVERLLGSRVIAVLPTIKSGAEPSGTSKTPATVCREHCWLQEPPRELEDAGYAQGIFSVYDWLREGAKNTTTRIVLIASADRGDGKSTMAINLADYAAKEGLRTALVDGDLRTRSLTLRLVPNLSHPIDAIDNNQATPYDFTTLPCDEGVDFCFARASADAALPMGILASVRFGKFLRSIAQNYDLVIVDTSSLSSSNEARAAFRLADAAILVLRAGHTSQPKLDEALAAASPPSDLRMGFVFNRTAKPRPSRVMPTVWFDAWRRRLARIFSPIWFSLQTWGSNWRS